MFKRIKFSILKQYYLYINRKYNNYDDFYNHFKFNISEDTDELVKCNIKRLKFDIEGISLFYKLIFEYNIDKNKIEHYILIYNKNDLGERPKAEWLVASFFVEILKKGIFGLWEKNI